MKYTKVSADAFKHLQLNAGVLLSSFTPAQPAVVDSNILGETSGGVSFKAEPEFIDFGDDIDNVPKNTKELKRIDSMTVTLSGTFISLTATLASKLVGAADVSGTKITPRLTLASADFADVWWVGDYSDYNDDVTATAGTGSSDGTAGFVAIRLINALNTNGFEIKSENRGKGTFPFEFNGHFSISSPETIPYEIYVAPGSAVVNGASG